MKAIGLVITIGVAFLLIYATADFAPFGDPSSPASLHVSPRYIEKTIEAVTETVTFLRKISPIK